ncbi:MAG: helix-turn-helix domain-containing protein [gamma proteobacterium symbiont of Taylorina sp.]|nr:helix-turn-helix domain-containing protein [gamma proteobacterium symbiont of Taylorina sp.]
MAYAMIKEKAHELFDDFPYVTYISNEADYIKALDLVEDLIEDYDDNEPLINIVVSTIDNWEENSDEFSEFNKEIELLDSDTSLLRVLMEQNKLKAEDLKNEIGGKSLVSMILNGKRKLTTEHIQSLSDRFNISPSLFFN